MEVFSAASHQHILILLFQISLLLLTAKLCGEIAQRLGQPAVVGELLAGIFLGPSVLGGIFPATKLWIVPQDALQGYLLEVISLMGAMLLLLITGIETDLHLIKRYLRTGVGVSLGALIVPFLSGLLLGHYLPDFLLTDPAQRSVFALFIATAMSISAIPVIAKVLIDMKLIRRELGQTIITAGMCDDTIGWILLSIVTGLAGGAGVSFYSIAKSVGAVVFFLVFSFTVGKWIVKRALVSVQNHVISTNKTLSLVLLLTFVWATLTMVLNLEAVFGAFVMGILFGRMSNLSSGVLRKLEGITFGFFAPIFFAVAGLKVNVRHLINPRLLLVSIVVIAIASGGKILGAYWGARFIGKRDRWTALSFGAGMNARGAMEIIIATIGLSLGILTQDMFSIIVVMAMVTSLMAPIMLRWTLKHVKEDEEELKRLKQEEHDKDSVIAGVHRVLLPVRFKENETLVLQTLEAKILDMVGGRRKFTVTLFNVAESGQKTRNQEYLTRLAPLFPQHELSFKVVEGTRPGDLILDEAQKNYDLLVLGASEQSDSSDTLFTPLVDYLVRVAPCPTLIVKGRNWNSKWSPLKILVPTNGSLAARNAAELAFNFASPERQVVILNAVVQGNSAWRYDNEGEMMQRESRISRHIVGELSRSGENLGVMTSAESRIGPNSETVILNYAETSAVDLIVLGTNLRPGSERLFLGPRVERILNNAVCPVIVFNSL